MRTHLCGNLRGNLWLIRRAVDRTSPNLGSQLRPNAPQIRSTAAYFWPKSAIFGRTHVKVGLKPLTSNLAELVPTSVGFAPNSVHSEAALAGRCKNNIPNHCMIPRDPVSSRHQSLQPKMWCNSLPTWSTALDCGQACPGWGRNHPDFFPSPLHRSRRGQQGRRGAPRARSRRGLGVHGAGRLRPGARRELLPRRHRHVGAAPGPQRSAPAAAQRRGRAPVALRCSRRVP